MKRWFSRLERHLVVVHHIDGLQSVRGYAVRSDGNSVTLSTAELLPDVEGQQPVKMAGEVTLFRDKVWFVQVLKAGA